MQKQISIYLIWSSSQVNYENEANPQISCLYLLQKKHKYILVIRCNSIELLSIGINLSVINVNVDGVYMYHYDAASWCREDTIV